MLAVIWKYFVLSYSNAYIVPYTQFQRNKNKINNSVKNVHTSICKVIKEKWGQYFANNHFCTPLCSKKIGSLGIKLFSKAKSTKPSG